MTGSWAVLRLVAATSLLTISAVRATDNEKPKPTTHVTTHVSSRYVTRQRRRETGQQNAALTVEVNSARHLPPSFVTQQQQSATSTAMTVAEHSACHLPATFVTGTASECQPSIRRRISADHFVHVRRNDAMYDWQSLAGGLDITGIIDESFATLDDDTAALCRAGRFGAAGETTFVLENSTVLQFPATDPCLKALFAASERMAAQIVEMVHGSVEI